MYTVCHKQQIIDGEAVRIVLFKSYVELPYLAMYCPPNKIDAEFKSDLQLEDNEHLIAIKTYKRSWNKVHKSLKHELCHMKLRNKNPIEYPEEAVWEELAVIKRTGLRIPASEYLLGLMEWLETEYAVSKEEAIWLILIYAQKSSLKRIRRKARQFIYAITKDNEQYNQNS